MPKVTEEHRAARRREIARAAIRLFAKQGFQATSMADIIAESGLSAGAIYGHYRSKDELVQTAIADLLELNGVTADAAADDALPPGEMMRRFLDMLESETGDLGLLVQVWGQAVLEPTARASADKIGLQLLGIYTGYLERWFRGGLGFSETEAATAARRYGPLYLGMMQGCVIQSAVFAGFDREAYLAAATSMMPAN